MKIAFYTLGCKVNQYETNLLREKFEDNGYIVVEDTEKADIYCINTCSVTNMSDRKTRQVISRMRKQNSNAVIAVLGCYAESLKGNAVEADIVIGNNDKKKVFELVQEYITKKEKRIYLEDISKVKKYTSQGNLKHGYEIRENIKIEDGCNNFCSYCIIPYVRGRVRSRNIVEIKEEAKNLSNNGVKEIVLVGIEVASYGQDLSSGLDLIDVIEEVSKTERIDRVRISSIEPRYLTEKNIERLSKIEKFCHHFHISMQSGSSSVLKRMNRKYDKNLLVDVCNNIHKTFKDATISVDCIVGFPGETNEEFNETVDTIEKINLMKLHVFKYSKRNFTVAAKMKEQVDGNIKKERSNVLLELSDKYEQGTLSKYINKKEKVLFESYKERYLYGYTSNYIMVKVRGDKSLCGTIQDVDLISLEAGQMLGIIK